MLQTPEVLRLTTADVENNPNIVLLIDRRHVVVMQKLARRVSDKDGARTALLDPTVECCLNSTIGDLVATSPCARTVIRYDRNASEADKESLILNFLLDDPNMDGLLSKQEGEIDYAGGFGSFREELRILVVPARRGVKKD